MGYMEEDHSEVTDGYMEDDTSYMGTGIIAMLFESPLIISGGEDYQFNMSDLSSPIIWNNNDTGNGDSSMSLEGQDYTFKLDGGATFHASNAASRQAQSPGPAGNRLVATAIVNFDSLAPFAGSGNGHLDWFTQASATRRSDILFYADRIATLDSTGSVVTLLEIDLEFGVDYVVTIDVPDTSLGASNVFDVYFNKLTDTKVTQIASGANCGFSFAGVKNSTVFVQQARETTPFVQRISFIKAVSIGSSLSTIADGPFKLDVPIFPHSLRYGDGYIYATCLQAAKIAKINTSTLERTFISVGTYPANSPVGIAYGNGIVMAADFNDDAIIRLDTSDDSVTSIPLGADTEPRDVAYDSATGFFWATLEGTNQIRRIAQDGTLGTTISIIDPYRIRSDDAGSLWITAFDANNVKRVSTSTETVTGPPITVGGGPWQAFKASDGFVYVSNFGSNTLSVIDPDTDIVIDTVNLTAAGGPHDITELGGNLYITQSAVESLAVVDVATRLLTGTLRTGFDPAGLDNDGTALWNTEYFDDSVTRRIVGS